MVSLFRNKKINDFKVAYLLRGNDRIYFKYNKVDREDYNDVNILTSVDATEGTLTIKTGYDLTFNTQDRILIKGITYKVTQVYTEDQEEENGVFVDSKIPVFYLVLKTLSNIHR